MSPTYPSKRAAILGAFEARLAVIRKQDGFRTDAGRQVFVGEVPQLGPDDQAHAVAILPQVDEVRWVGRRLGIVWPMVFAAVVRGECTDVWLEVEQVLADLKTAIELPDRSLGGLLQHPFERGTTQSLERETGSLVSGVAVTYQLVYTEDWGAP